MAQTAYYNDISFELVGSGSAARELSYPQRRQVPQSEPKPAAQPKVSNARAILLVTMVAAVAFALVVFGYFKLYQVRSSVEAANAHIAALQEQNVKLKGQYNNMVDYRAIEDDAINRLGMMKPSSGQTVYVNLAGADRGEVLSGHHTSLFGEGAKLVSEAFSGLTAYFQ